MSNLIEVLVVHDNFIQRTYFPIFLFFIFACKEQDLKPWCSLYDMVMTEHIPGAFQDSLIATEKSLSGSHRDVH
jgi:hypothetical protein